MEIYINDDLNMKQFRQMKTNNKPRRINLQKMKSQDGKYRKTYTVRKEEK